MVLDFFQKAKEVLENENRFVLLVVIANAGSSPGRKGFKMLVSKNQLYGTIGGGIMEHKLVELAQNLLLKPAFEPFIKQQIHNKNATTNQSGMICSGEQTIAFFDITAKYLLVLNQILTLKNGTINYSNQGITTASIRTEKLLWFYEEKNDLVQKVYIIGGGHVSLALSEVLARLDFEIHVLDHRENLNTMTNNPFAQTKQTVLFEEIEKYIPEGNTIYVVIMSFGYRTDDCIIRQLITKNYKYIGLLGSKAKIATLFQNLISDGFDAKQIAKVHAPIGIDIKSETTQEIAISVAAQLIQVKNT